ncbi:hypothetical protein [Sabulicella glaciei]|uniref:DUF4815 domain-containing protein n=1 Tax=Sabulicella glaciei TaxID=2984948 RepID=A0ABT3NZ00_9PROT|nr:hypothetical protein [Roseococcus sp. MDT2-1-1]MCW8087358.1 hypothetical protein [Roseococcus sp. MDT2-1-1]
MPMIVPPTLLNLAVLPGLPGEPHIRNGNHLRVAHHPLLGLPVAPFIVQRATLERLPDQFAVRRDVVFRDRNGVPLTLPITVRKGDEVHATIVQGTATSCILVSMLTRPLETPPVRQPLGRGRLAVREPVLPANAFDRLDGQRLSAVVTAAPRAATSDTSSKSLVMRAVGASVGNGPTLLGERRGPPYTVAAPGIVEVVITGQGIIADLVWLGASDLDRLDWRTIEVLNLPHQAGRRYLSVNDPFKRSEACLRRQAPKLAPLQETSGAIAPTAAPPFSEPEESDRVHTLGDPLAADLNVLIDGAAAPLTASETIEVTDAAGHRLSDDPAQESSIAISHLGRVLQATLDPGVAAWLGYKGIDDRDPPEGVAFYRVFGFFRHPLGAGADPKQLQGVPVNVVPEPDRTMSAPETFRTWIKLAGNVLETESEALVGELEPAGDYMMMGAVAAVDRRAPPEPPASPELLAPEHIAWLPAAPPTAVREVDCPIRGLLVGATLAGERQQPLPGGGLIGLNRSVGARPWHALLTLGLTSQADGTPLVFADGRQGSIGDRYAGPDAARYYFAQQDRFGRWSNFAARDAAAGPRPKPPRPVLQGSYQQPAPPSAAAITGGTFSLRVALPEPAALAPGSYPLSHVRMSFRHSDATVSGGPEIAMPDVDAPAASAIVVEAPPPLGQPPQRAVPVTVTGPVLAASAQRRMVITARWFDTAGQGSEVSEPLRLTMTDPRPPAQLAIPDTLLYSSRPDATGLAWVERAWPVAASDKATYAAYYTDENRLLAWLRAEGRTSEANAIAATEDRAARAGMMRAIQGDFPDYLFERLPGAVVSPSATQRRLRHAVSGSSRILNAYKIAAEAGQSGARPDLSGLDMVFYGVPNSDPPPRPSVTVRLVEPQAGEPDLVVEVTVILEAGMTRGQTARIFRTRGTQADPMHAPLVADLPFSAPDPDSGQQRVVLRDVGAAGIAPAARLAAFFRYQWLAQAQGAPESGSDVPGMWSRPSDPVSLATVPMVAPATPVFGGFGGTTVAGGTQDLTLAISHPLGLAPTALGPWRYEVLRAAPGEDPTLMAAGSVGAVPFTIADPVSGGVTPSATLFTVRLFDPIGRPTPALSLITS